MDDVTVAWEKLEDWDCCCGDPEHQRPGQWKWVARCEGNSCSGDTQDEAKRHLGLLLQCRREGRFPTSKELAELYV